MSYEAIRDYLKTKLEALPSVGVVQDYYRNLKSKEVKTTLFEDGILNVWFIRKISERNRYEGPGYGLRTHIINIVGVMRLDDLTASEKTFLLILKDIIGDLESDYTYGGLVFQNAPPILTKHQHQNFAGYLSHYAIIQVAPTEQITL